jgi:hypothetical protein
MKTEEIKEVYMVAENCFVTSIYSEEANEDYEAVCIHNLGIFLNSDECQKKCEKLNTEKDEEVYFVQSVLVKGKQ